MIIDFGTPVQHRVEHFCSILSGDTYTIIHVKKVEECKM